jgi:fatty-acyl-CoA synthase
VYIGDHARNQPDKPAAIRASTGETRSYKALDERSNRLAQLLYAHGLRPGDHVALYSENSLVFFDVIFACMRSGLYLTPVNRYLAAPEAAYIVGDSDAKALIASAALDQSQALGALSPQCELKLAVGGPIPGFADFEAAIAAHPAQPLAEERLGSFMLYSSGTTGRPKGIRRPLPDTPPDGGSAPLSRTASLFGIDGEAIYLSPAPLYHSAPIGYTSGVIQQGGTVIMMDKFDAENALKYIEAFSVTHSQWVPTMFTRMLKLEPEVRGRYDLSSHRCAIHAAAPCPVEVKRQMIEWWGPIIQEYYASTEAAGMSIISSEDWLEHPGSVGRSPLAAFHVCDETGRELGPGESGLIYGETPAGGEFSYHKDPGKTAEARHPTHPDWVTVGDVGYMNEEGYLYLTDRKAFMIISGGVNIYPQQIEDALALHPKIGDVAVIGVPNPDLGEEVKAIVEPAPGVTPSEALGEEIMAFVQGKLGRQLTPRSVDFVDELPRLPTGKLYKKILRDKYWGESTAGVALAARI